MTPTFPLSAIQGQAQLVQALLLAAIEPALGGVLIQGPRGTAKSTAARALADLLAPAPFVTLPLGASIEHVVGSLDLSKALSGNEVAFAPGLLARAHGGVLYVDEINLLPDAIVDVLLDVAASGVNRVERDGISHDHAARFVLIGTMNPEEGMLRPQLLDRLGLCVQLANAQDPALRSAIVKARLRFDLDPVDFLATHATQQTHMAERLRQARARCAEAAELPWSDAVHEEVARQCIAACVDGLRADLVMLRAARALAVWEGCKTIESRHVAQVAPLVLLHRANQTAGDAAQRQAPSPSSASAPTAEQSPVSSPESLPDPSPAASAPSALPEQSANPVQSGPPERNLEQPPPDWGAPQPMASAPVAALQADALAQAAMEALAAKKARAPGLPR
ncbi:ATP-binding protein [Comamonas odontotermitis]|uniref:ATP-binding protein n=1 Tax=Comamonas odontotermitis TaxID=379895 RepID=UPI001CC3B170|nr:AAA family ATPase [Comamonas odontotermitis]UBB16802.1 ATP-binding protein [Comamonas odontotermitis]